MAKRIGGGNVYIKPTPKKTRQGQSHNTKYGTKDSKKYYKKPYNSSGQGR